MLLQWENLGSEGDFGESRSSKRPFRNDLPLGKISGLGRPLQIGGPAPAAAGTKPAGQLNAKRELRIGRPDSHRTPRSSTPWRRSSMCGHPFCRG